MEDPRPGPQPLIALSALDYLRGQGWRSTGTISRAIGERSQRVHRALLARPEWFDTRKAGRRRIWRARVTDE